MALPTKERFKEIGLRKKLDFKQQGSYRTFVYNRKTMIILGPSEKTDLLGTPARTPQSAKNMRMSQYYACDADGNMYQCAVQEYEINSKKMSLLIAMASIPPK